jgi:hypothetical protein
MSLQNDFGLVSVLGMLLLLQKCVLFSEHPHGKREVGYENTCH